jgi:hypothetical protein
MRWPRPCGWGSSWFDARWGETLSPPTSTIKSNRLREGADPARPLGLPQMRKAWLPLPATPSCPAACGARANGQPNGAGGRVGPKPLVARALGQQIMDQDFRSVGITFASPCSVMTVRGYRDFQSTGSLSERPLAHAGTGPRPPSSPCRRGRKSLCRAGGFMTAGSADRVRSRARRSRRLQVVHSYSPGAYSMDEARPRSFESAKGSAAGGEPAALPQSWRRVSGVGPRVALG